VCLLPLIKAFFFEKTQRVLFAFHFIENIELVYTPPKRFTHSLYARSQWYICEIGMWEYVTNLGGSRHTVYMRDRNDIYARSACESMWPTWVVFIIGAHVKFLSFELSCNYTWCVLLLCRIIWDYVTCYLFFLFYAHII
jgi:hypothetical protein